MYEDETYERILKRCLARVPDDVDKRQGSIIYDAIAPACFELAELYIVAQTILKQTFATTADREFLIKRTKEFNLEPYEATFALVKGVFNINVPLGSRFNYEKLNFEVIEKLEENTFSLKCETPGKVGNYCIGNITPIISIDGLTSAKITELIAPANDEEETEAFRKRYFAALKSKAYGGNGHDYKEKVNAIEGVGGCKVYRGLYGGGTVGVTIINNQFKIPSSELVNQVQTALDPVQNHGEGYGLAPIGHTVTVKAVTTIPISVTMSLFTVKESSFSTLRGSIEKAITEYLDDLSKNWAEQTEKGTLTVRSAHVLSKILSVVGVVDVTNLKINGQTDRVELGKDEIPILGSVSSA